MLLNKIHKLTADNKLDTRKKNLSEWTSRFGQVHKSDSRDRIGKQASVLISMCVSLGPIKKENISKKQKSSKKSSKAYSPPLFYAIFPLFFFFI